MSFNDKNKFDLVKCKVSSMMYLSKRVNMTYGCIKRSKVFRIREVIVLSYSLLTTQCLKHCVQFSTQDFKEAGVWIWD